MSKKMILPSGFQEMGLTEPVLKALNDVGYETPPHSGGNYSACVI